MLLTRAPYFKTCANGQSCCSGFVSNKDIGFVRVGQVTKLRIDAFPYNEFGGLDGVIKSIGSDVLEPDENYNFYRFPLPLPYLQFPCV